MTTEELEDSRNYVLGVFPYTLQSQQGVAGVVGKQCDDLGLQAVIAPAGAVEIGFARSGGQIADCEKQVGRKLATVGRQVSVTPCS